MPVTPLHIIHVEDDANDAELVRMQLKNGGLDAEIFRADTIEAFMAAIAQPCDLILADYSLRTGNGLDILRIAQQRRPEIPIIFVTGALGEERAVELLTSGATDYVLKDQPGRLGSSIRRALREASEHRQRREAEDALRRSE